MAALLCQSFGNLCVSCGACLTEPCKQCCGGLSQILGQCCKGAAKVICSPFFPYIATTVALNLPPAMFGLQSITTPDCYQVDFDGSKTWLPINAILALCHIIASFYIAFKIQKEQEIMMAADANLVQAETGTANKTTATTGATAATGTATATPTTSTSYQLLGGAAARAFPIVGHAQRTTKVFTDDDDGEANSFQRLGKVMCYDAGVAIYILVAVGWLVWQSVGFMEVVSSGGNNGNDGENGIDCPLVEWITMSLACGMIYCMVVCVVFSCSFLCMR